MNEPVRPIQGPDPPISLERIEEALKPARKVLREHGYDWDISAEDLRAYSEAETLYPSAISWNAILRNRLIVAHEVVEIAELKRMGLEITPDVIIGNLEEVYQAHLVASEAEMGTSSNFLSTIARSTSPALAG